jgi:cell division protein ZapA
MPQVTLQINGKDYPVGCGAGEEAHVEALGRYIDLKVRELAKRLGRVGEAQLLLLACVTLADELGEAVGDLGAARAETKAGAKRGAGDGKERELAERLGALEKKAIERDHALADRLDAVARKLSGLADRLQRA